MSAGRTAARVQVDWAKPSPEELLRALSNKVAERATKTGNEPKQSREALLEEIRFTQSEPQLNQLVGRIHATNITEAEKESLLRLVNSKRMPGRAPQLAQTALGRAARNSLFAARRHPKSPDRLASRDRRRQLGGDASLPPQLRNCYTQGENAVLSVVRREHERRCVCTLPNDAIAAIAGCSVSTVHNALRAASLNLHIKVIVRPRRGRKNDTNIIRIISTEWIAWIESRRRNHADVIGYKSKKFDPTEREDKKVSGRGKGNHACDCPSIAWAMPEPSTLARERGGEPWPGGQSATR